MIRGALSAARQLDDSRLGDLIATVLLLVMSYALFVIAGVLS